MSAMDMEESRIALIGIIVEDLAATEDMNRILHAYAPYIVGRMGLPYRKNNVSIVSVVMDAPQGIISAVSGKLGMIKGLNVKTMISKASV